MFGPWVGEFSYELSWWNPECRYIASEKQFKDAKVVHLGFQGRKVAYKDFVDEYIPHPPELEDTLQYPATYGEHIGGRDVIPPIFMQYAESLIKKYAEEGYEVIWHRPGDIPITRDRCLAHEPKMCKYNSYEVDTEIENSVKKMISDKFGDGDTVLLMARYRTRKGKTCYLDWNPDNWIEFTRMLIEKLNLNVIAISIPTKGSRGGSLSLADKLPEYADKIMNFEIANDEDSLEKQYAILKNTKCSIYGASGAAVVPFFVNTPTFTQQTKEEGFRLELGWERNLTNDLENVVIFDKYHNSEIYDSPVEELFNEFEKFYKGL